MTIGTGAALGTRMRQENSRCAAGWRRGRGLRNTPAWLAGLAAAALMERSALACTARLVEPFHLRARAEVRSSGPELPAGTEVEVLGTSGVHRAGPDGRPSAPVLSHVRVIATGAEGYAFVGPRELDAGCPLLPAMPPGGAVGPRIGHWWNVNLARSPGVPETPARELTRWSVFFDAAQDEVLARFDADHNGSEETLVRTRADGDDGPLVVLMREGVRGAPGIIVDQEWGFGHRTIRYGAVIHAGRADYVVMEYWSVGACFGCRGVACDVAERRLMRLHPDGWFVEVARVPRESGGEEITLRGEPDGAVTAEGKATGRTQRLRFDGPTFALVPEGPTMPVIGLGLGLCRGW